MARHTADSTTLEHLAIRATLADADGRGTAATALGMLGTLGQDVLPVLLARTEVERAEVVFQDLCTALGMIGTQPARARLEDLRANDPRPVVRIYAEHALRIGR